MKREIKFRGKRIDNGEWVYGWYIQYEHMGVIKHYIVTNWAQIYVNSYEVDPETVGQYMGRQDQKGKEICKGDVIEYPYVYTGRNLKFTAYVDWSDELLCYCLRNMDGTWKSEAHAYDFENNSEVIGNRWDNPDLLEGGYE